MTFTGVCIFTFVSAFGLGGVVSAFPTIVEEFGIDYQDIANLQSYINLTLGLGVRYPPRQPLRFRTDPWFRTFFGCLWLFTMASDQCLRWHQRWLSPLTYGVPGLRLFQVCWALPSSLPSARRALRPQQQQLSV